MKIGVFKKIGFKLGAWHDARWFQLHLIEHPDNPAKPKAPNEVQNTADFKAILLDANSKLTDKKTSIL